MTVGQRSSPATEGLGSLQASYGSSRENAALLVIAVAACALGGLVLLGVGLTRDTMRELVVLSGGGVLALLLGGLLLFIYRREGRAGIDVFDQGFVYTDRRRRRLVARWDDVAEVYEMPIYHRPERRSGVVGAKYTVHLADGRQFKLGVSIQDIRSFGATLKAEVNQRLLPQAIDTYKAGRSVSFGPKLSLHRESVTCDGEKLPWREVSGIDLREGAKIGQVGQRRPWQSVPSWDLANKSVLKDLLRAIELRPEGRELPGTLKAEAPMDKKPGGAGIGNISARIGYDVRELLMLGYSMEEIHGIERGEYDVRELLSRKPGGGKRR
jgi:hypothetical protein